MKILSNIQILVHDLRKLHISFAPGDINIMQHRQKNGVWPLNVQGELMAKFGEHAEINSRRKIIVTQI